MKSIKKVEVLPAEINFERDFTSVPPRKVQGGALYALEKNAFLVESGGRYKVYSERVDYVKILEGDGHFKWARGETPFHTGDAFCVSEAGEYEVNGARKFAVVRK